MQQRSWMTAILFVFIGMVGLWLYTPVIMLILFSFNPIPSVNYPLMGFDTRWYATISPNLITPLLNSIQVSLVSMAVTIGVATSVALALRKPRRGRFIVFYLVMMGMIIPGVSLGMSTALLYQILGVSQSVWTALPLHVVWAVPFGVFLLLVRFDPDLVLYEQAARALGASGFRVFREVTLPLITPQIIAVGLLGFLLSWSELMRSVFVTGAQSTLPIFLFASVTVRPVTPNLFAFATIVTVVTIVLLVAAGILLTRGGRRKIL